MANRTAALGNREKRKRVEGGSITALQPDRLPALRIAQPLPISLDELG
jgi:hypothetical protein